TGTFVQSGGTLNSSDVSVIVGVAGAGAFVHSAGTHSTGGDPLREFYVGQSAGSVGSYTLGGTGALIVSAASEYIGFAAASGSLASASGTFIQTGGTHTAGGFQWVGFNGVGTYVHSGGTNSPAALGVGNGATSNGTYLLSGTGALSTSEIYLGNGPGTGTFEQTGGSHTAAAVAYLGFAGTATYAHSAGTFSVGVVDQSIDLYIGRNAGSLGTYTLSGTGSLVVADHEVLGANAASGTLAAGAGAFVQSGGTHTVGGAIIIGDAGAGSYTHSAGTFTAGAATLGGKAGGTGRYIISDTAVLQAGTISIANAAASGTLAAASGTFTQTGGSVTTSDSMTVGSSGPGTYAHSGGTLTVGTGSFTPNLTVGNNAGSAGTYLLSGSAVVTVGRELSLGAGATPTVSASGTVIQTGGSITVADRAIIGALGVGSYQHTSGTFTVGTTGGTRELIVANAAGSQGRYTLGGDASLNVSASVTLAVAGSLTNSFGTFAPSAATFVQEGGTHTIGNRLNVGFGGVGAYEHTAGTLTGNDVRVGHNAGSSGSYTLSGTATLDTDSAALIVGFQPASGTLAPAAGLFTQTGGTHLARVGATIGYQGSGSYVHSGGTFTIGTSATVGSLIVGSQSGGMGRYTLSAAGTLNVQSLTQLGFAAGAQGTFVQSGGSHAAQALDVGAFGSGTYQQSGGTTTVRDILRIGTSAGAAGAVSFSAGSLAVGTTGVNKDLYVGMSGNGALNVSNTASLNVGDDVFVGFNASGVGAVTQTGGTFAVASDLTVGRLGAGTYAHSGGSLSVAGTLFVRSGASGVAGSYTLSGAGSLTAGVINNRGTIQWNGGSLAAGTVQLNDGGTMNLAAGGTKVLVVNAATVDTVDNSKLDLADNKMIVRNAAGQYASYANLIRTAHHMNAWDGGGITTSMPDAIVGLTSLGIAPAGATGHAGLTFGGVSVGATDLLIMYTYGGDATLDGFISGDDYSAIDFNVGTSADAWYNGDFNYDGIISGDDYSTIDFNYAAQGAPFPTSASTGAAGVTAVPEPGCGLALVAASALLVGRRGRRR
ncbi:MAG: hypothetical protein QOF78_2819, partial [Phycisphaerales bacterium]|nr:hypothetical protein [Phycisphaerales bacterium]